MVSKADIRDIVRRITERFDPERIVLFGSHAYGTPTPDSDLDLLVILEFSGPAYMTAARIREALPMTIPMDVIARTPSQMRDATGQASPAVEEAIRRGIVLHERAA